VREETLVKNLVRHRGIIQGMIAAMVGNPSTAEDLFQEVAVVMTRKRAEADEDCRFVAWGRRIAVNVVRDWRKKQARHPLRFLGDADLESVAAAFEETREEDWDARRQALQRCVDKLPDRERLLLSRRYQASEPIEEIAASIPASRGAVDTMLYRIRKALLQCVETKLRHEGVS
jgi:RNA polymerase sigma-70 factor (ECF subfamily)